MRFVFNERKAAQAAAHLLNLHGGKMEYLKLIKLLYLADRKGFIESGYPTTGDQMVSTDNGPMLSRIHDLILFERESTAWHEHICPPESYTVTLRQASDGSELSEYDDDILGAVHDAYGQWDQWALADYTKTLPEWQDPGGCSLAIDPAVILREAGFSDADIRTIASQVESSWAIQHVGSRVG